MPLGTRVILGIPTTRYARRSISWIEALANLQMPLGSSLARIWTEDETIANARNRICRAALEQGCDYVFFLSDDVLPPPNALLQMLERIGREYPVGDGKTARASMITGVYWTKTYPPEPYLWNGLLKGSYQDWTVGEFFPVDMAGCDCLLIEADVLRQLPEPWFSTDWAWEPGQQPSSIATEDFYFYLKARQHGFRLFADTAIQCLHEDRSTGILFGLTSEMPQAGGVAEYQEGDQLIADLGAGFDTPYFGPKAVVVRFDTNPDTKPDVRCDLRAIPDQYLETFDVVHARHVLEHFSRREAPQVVRHWAQLLKVGGELVIRVPNLEWAFKVLTDEGAASQDIHYAWAQLYGGQTDDHDYHRNGFTARKLRSLLRTVPELEDVTVETENGGVNLKATARLARKIEPEALGPMWEAVQAQEQPQPAAKEEAA